MCISEICTTRMGGASEDSFSELISIPLLLTLRGSTSHMSRNRPLAMSCPPRTIQIPQRQAQRPLNSHHRPRLRRASPLAVANAIPRPSRVNQSPEDTWPWEIFNRGRSCSIPQSLR